MKRLLIVLMMLFPVAAMGQTKAVAKEFPLMVHVVSSRIEGVPNGSVTVQNVLDLLRVRIEGRKYVLAVIFREGLFESPAPTLIEPGDYRARVTLDKTPNPGEVRRRYELRLAKGKTVRAYLWGIG